MSNYWPIVFWMADVTDKGVMVYKPSSFHAQFVRGYGTYEAALRYGQTVVSKDNRPNLHAMPTFTVRVIESDEMPDHDAQTSSLMLLVTRIPLND